jgi:ADP-ribose pyrophosphatase YjhB (NUDIX family)
MSNFNNIPNHEITDTDGQSHWISPSASVDALLIVNGFVLVTKRSANMPDNAGLWCIPCGFMDWNEDILRAAMRELHEETGVDVREHNIINKDYIRPFALNGTALQFAFELLERPEVNLNPEECQDYKWVSISMLNDLEWAFGHHLLIKYILSYGYE